MVYQTLQKFATTRGREGNLWRITKMAIGHYQGVYETLTDIKHVGNIIFAALIQWQRSDYRRYFRDKFV